MLLDAIILLTYFTLITAIGVIKGRRDHTLEDYALGGRRIPWWAVMASIIAAETSAATFLGAPGEGYDKKSLAYVQLVLGVIIGRVIVGSTFLKPFYKYRVYTVYEYVGIRFGPLTRSYVSGLFLIMRTLASGTRLFVPSLVMVLAWRMFTGGTGAYGQQAVTGVAPYVIAITALTIATCIYTAIGGIKAVIWTDLIQATLMFGSALIAAGVLYGSVGGWAAVTHYAPAMAHLEGYVRTGLDSASVQSYMTAQHVSSMNVWQYVKLILGSEYTIFAAIIGASMMNMAAFGTDQDMVQRLLTASTYQSARRSLITAALMDVPIAVTFTFIGILLFAFLQQHPPVHPVATADVFGYYILHAMPVGIRGLVLAGLFATAMGSLSTALNSLATSATSDWWLPYMKKGRETVDAVMVARWMTLVFAVLMVLVATAFAFVKVNNPNVRIIPVVLGIASYILGPMLGVFLLGLFTKRRGSDRGNMIAITCGLAVTAIMGDLPITVLNLIGPKFGLRADFQHPAWLPHIAFTWFAVVGAVTVLAVGLLFGSPGRANHEAVRPEQDAPAETSLASSVNQAEGASP